MRTVGKLTSNTSTSPAPGDGIYELVNVVNPDRTVMESDTSNNEASTIFQVTGNQIQTLRYTGYAPAVRYGDAVWV